MPRTWLTSDHHFGHTNIIKYCKRPFVDANHMDGVLLRKWNERVASDDEVLHLGDFSFHVPYYSSDIYNKLNGNKSLVIGNHDVTSSRMHRIGFTKVDCHKRVSGEHRWIYLCHDPYHYHHKHKAEDVELVLNGHVHEKWKVNKINGMWHINVGVDVWDFYPVSLEEVLALYDKTKSRP